MSKVRTITGVAILTAMYVVLSAFFKVNLVGNIMLDLGYIAFAVGLAKYGLSGIFIGVVGCAIESMVFGAYGFSISWCIANALIGLVVAFGFKNVKNKWLRYAIVVFGVAIGVLGAKTAVECYLYQIPVAVKIIKNFVAFMVDSLTMMLGVYLVDRVGA